MVEPVEHQAGLVRFFVNALFAHMEAGDLEIADCAEALLHAMTLLAAGRISEANSYMRTQIAQHRG